MLPRNVGNCQYTLHNISEERIFHLHCGEAWNLEYRQIFEGYFIGLILCSLELFAVPRYCCGSSPVCYRTSSHFISTWTQTAGFVRLGPVSFDGNMTSLLYQLC